jgi:TatD DNase family protein
MSESLPAPLFDAHLHLQDERLTPCRTQVIDDLRAAGIQRWVVNGTCEADWEAVAQLANEYPEVLPCFGLHPWQTKGRSEHWQAQLLDYLEKYPHAGVGEIGLDKWIRGYDLDDQEIVFRAQLELAVELQRPAMIHCLKCHGRLLEVLKDSNLPADYRFLLHSYGGPQEMVADFAKLGAMFSFSGYFLEERKAATRDAFAAVPIERLLIETDAPDMPLPEALLTATLPSNAGSKRLNHPANLPVIYLEMAKLCKLDENTVVQQVALNFGKLFRDYEANRSSQ